MIIYHHLGLGDHIICNGLVRHFAETLEIILLCKKHNAQNVQFMYRDNPNIKIHEIINDDEANRFCDSHNNMNILRIGFAVGGKRYYDCLWDENFYRNAYIDFNFSWTKFYLMVDSDRSSTIYQKLNPNNEEFIFVHNIDSTNTDRINYSAIHKDIKIIKTNPDIDFFDYYDIIQQAKEIHCIDSSFKHLVDRIPTKAKLFYHKMNNPKQFDLHNHKKEWIIV